MLPHPQFTKKRVSAPLPIVTLLTAFALATANTANAVRDRRYPEPLLHKSHDSGARIPVFSPLVKPNSLLWRHEWRFPLERIPAWGALARPRIGPGNLLRLTNRAAAAHGTDSPATVLRRRMAAMAEMSLKRQAKAAIPLGRGEVAELSKALPC